MKQRSKERREVEGRKKEKDRKKKDGKEEETKGSYPDWKRQNYIPTCRQHDVIYKSDIR